MHETPQFIELTFSDVASLLFSLHFGQDDGEYLTLTKSGAWLNDRQRVIPDFAVVNLQVVHPRQQTENQRKMV
jgi:hypothetical protein